MKRSHTKAAPKHRLVQRSYSSQHSRELSSDDMDKIMAKYDKDCKNEAPQNHRQKTKLEILSSQRSKLNLLLGHKYEKFARQISKSPNNRTYYSRENSEISSGSFFGFSMPVMITKSMAGEWRS